MVFLGEKSGIEGAKVVTIAKYTTEILPPFLAGIPVAQVYYYVDPGNGIELPSGLQVLGNGHIWTVCRGQLCMPHHQFWVLLLCTQPTIKLEEKYVYVRVLSDEWVWNLLEGK